MERFLDYFKSEKYVLDIAIDKHKKTIGGVVKVSGEVLNDTVKFHAVDLKITDVMVNGKKVEFKADGEVLVISKLELGEAEIVIHYNGNLNENMEGAYLSTYEYEGKTETIVATQFESHYAREAFPCIDEPAAKAEFEVNIEIPDKDDLVLVNTPSPRMSTYLLAWVIGKFHGKTVTNKHGVEITTYGALNQNADSVDFANEVAAKSLEFYDDNFGVAYPLRKLDQVALPDFEAGAMENWGLVTYRESMLLASRNATLSTKKSVALTVAHELSHQWFGDLVTMEWWDDLWLNESFATVMEYYTVDAAYPEFKIFEGFFTGDAYAALMRDAYSDVQSVHQEVHDPEEIATLFDPAIVYAKGARLMLMLIRLMGWESFCKGIRDYFEKFQYRNTVGDDLWACLGPYADFEPKELMHAFIDRPGYPVITGEEGFLKYSQKRFLLDGEMTKSDWPLPDVSEDMSGHYILNLSEEEFNKRLEDFDSLGLEEKVRLLIDRNLIAKTKLASSATLLSLVQKFENESSAAVWNIVLSIIANLKIFFDMDSEEERRYKKFVGRLIQPKLKELGLVTCQDDDENVIRLRAILLGLDYYAETKDNIEALAKFYDDDYGKIDVEIREAVLDAKLYLKPNMIEQYLQRYREEADPELKAELLLAGAVSKDAKVLAKMIGLLGNYEVVKPQDQLHLFIYLYRNSRAREQVYQWLVTHWDEVAKMAGDKSLDSYPRYMANIIRTNKEYQEWLEFFEPMSDNPALARAIAIGKKEIVARLKLIKEDQEAVQEMLSLSNRHFSKKAPR